MSRISRYRTGFPRGDDRRVISGIIFVIRNGLRWRDAPAEYGLHKTIYNRVIRWCRMGVFNMAFVSLAAKGGKPDRLMIAALTPSNSQYTSLQPSYADVLPILVISLSPREKCAHPLVAVTTIGQDRRQLLCIQIGFFPCPPFEV